MQYRKKPVVITAIQLTLSSIELVNEFLGITGKGSFNDCGYGIDPETGSFKITTPEGVMVANIGDWIIKGVNGEFCPCKPDIFEKTYEAVESENCDCGEAPQTTNLDFGQAVRYMKEGRLIRRAGWNGKGMHVYLEDHFSFVVPTGVFKGNKRTYLPVMVMFNAKGEHQPGWNASTADVLANDWQVVE